MFNQWARDYVSLEQSEWLAIDGKSIKCTVSNYDNAAQNFVSVVSVFSTAPGLTISLSQFKHKDNSEITVLQA
ncbi:hypothetical protein [Microseira wollei]|uniref:Transposase n=1 Tax=Microseira wollei NIES-4236 TaxID=2530354 RepID=A0AAV3XU86_9CYAN|nr:hypothetical protein [Microseira wollei]GET43917.1 transposase [Microseira wollei NIES-4236]